MKSFGFGTSGDESEDDDESDFESDVDDEDIADDEPLQNAKRRRTQERPPDTVVPDAQRSDLEVSDVPRLFLARVLEDGEGNSEKCTIKCDFWAPCYTNTKKFKKIPGNCGNFFKFGTTNLFKPLFKNERGFFPITEDSINIDTNDIIAMWSSGAVKILNERNIRALCAEVTVLKSQLLNAIDYDILRDQYMESL